MKTEHILSAQKADWCMEKLRAETRKLFCWSVIPRMLQVERQIFIQMYSKTMPEG